MLVYLIQRSRMIIFPNESIVLRSSQRDQGKVTSVRKATAPVRAGRRGQCNAGGDACTTRAMTPVQQWQGASPIQARTPAQCREMCQLCEVNVSQAALLWTAAIVSGVMTPARGEQRCQRDAGEYACTRKKMTSSTSGSAQGNPQRQAALPGMTIQC